MPASIVALICVMMFGLAGMAAAICGWQRVARVAFGGMCAGLLIAVVLS